MTREEKIKGLYNLKEYLVENPIELEGHKSLPITLIDYAIEELEQEPIDKIREQIKSDLRGVEITLEVLVENDPLRPKMEGAKDTLENCLEIIDKAESEDNNEL